MTDNDTLTQKTAKGRLKTIFQTAFDYCRGGVGRPAERLGNAVVGNAFVHTEKTERAVGSASRKRGLHIVKFPKH